MQGVRDRACSAQGGDHAAAVDEDLGAARKPLEAGLAVADVNGDGYLDIYVCQAGHYLKSAPLRNQLFEPIQSAYCAIGVYCADPARMPGVPAQKSRSR